MKWLIELFFGKWKCVQLGSCPHGIVYIHEHTVTKRRTATADFFNGPQRANVDGVESLIREWGQWK